MTSILDPDRHRFDRSAYERPNVKYRCGRGAVWGKPCMRGPNPDGSCGGVTACNPAKNKNGRYECRRSAVAGGPCQNGPQPDGRCSDIQPPCMPRRSLRGIRGRLCLLALGLVLAFIGGFSGLSKNSLFGLNWANPGPLAANHAGFITADDCKLCHAAHNSGAAGWFAALFTPADVSAKCTNCHSFDGPARQAHNRANPKRPDMGETSCLMCHTEHKGAAANITEHSDVQCASCHEKSFTSFSQAHPKFSARFPYDRRTAIKFDHGSHFAKYFTDPRYAEKAPATCLSCHSQDPNQRSLVRASFDNNCAACHGDQIAKRELVVLRFPEFTEDTIDRDRVLEACGPTTDEFERLIEKIEALEAGDEPEEDEEDDEFESVSTEEKSIIGAYLLDVAADDPDIYNDPMQEFVLAMAEDGLSPLAQLINEREDREVADQLLAGLNPEVMKQIACAWAANLEYELPEEASLGGWYGDYLELLYRPLGHGDAVSKAWIEFGLASAQQAGDDESGERTIAMRDSLIDPKSGVGACAKCHSVNAATADDDETSLAMGWRARDVLESDRNFQFSHGVHINLLDARMTDIAQSGRGCRVCHILDPQADFAAGYGDFDTSSYTSNFKAIDKNTCTDCHAKGNVREGCQLCHDYHRKPFFKIRISKNE